MNGRGRICFLTAAYPSDTDPSRGCFIESLASEIVKNGYSVQVLAPRIYTADKRREIRKGVLVSRFSFLSGNQLLREYEKIPILRMLSYLVSGCSSLIWIVWKHRINLIHAHWVIPTGFIAVLAKKITHVPVLLSAHGADINLYPRKNRLLFKIAAFSLRHANEITAVSEELKNKIRNEFGIISKRITVVSCGVDLETFRPMDQKNAREKLKLPQQAKIVLFIGDLIPLKGLHHLIESIPDILKRQDQAVFLIIGKGFFERDLANMVENRGLKPHVRFMGAVPNEEVPLWLNAADLLVLPSTSEGTPVVVMEALSCGVPVVASRVGGIPELVKDGENGLLVKSDDPNSLGEALIRLLTDDRLLQTLRQRCLRDRPNTGVDQKAKNLCSVYERILS